MEMDIEAEMVMVKEFGEGYGDRDDGGAGRWRLRQRW